MVGNNYKQAVIDAKNDIGEIIQRVKDLQEEIKNASNEAAQKLGKMFNVQNSDGLEKLAKKQEEQIKKMMGTLDNYKKTIDELKTKLEALQNLQNNSSGTDKQKNAYQQLVAEQKKALKELQHLITVHGKHNSEVQRAQITYDALTERVKKLNIEITKESSNHQILSQNQKLQTQSTSELAGSYGRLIAEQKIVKKELLNLTAQYGINSDQVKEAQARYDELTVKIKSINNAINENIVAEQKKSNASKNSTNATKQQSGAYNDLLSKQRAAKRALQDAIVQFGRNSRAARQARKDYTMYAGAVQRANVANNNFAKGGLRATLRGFRNLTSAFGLVGATMIFADLVRQVFSLVKTFDALNFALERITGSMNDAADSSAFILDITKRFGAELVSTTNRWIKFMAAAKQSGLTMKQTEDIFRSMTKTAGVLGLRTDELVGIYLALEQMLSKGKVTTEELRRQLGERLPGAMGIMAASMGVSISQLDKMMKKGEVLSAEVLPGFAKAVEIAYGIQQVEKVDTLIAAQNRLTTAWQHFVKTVFTNSEPLRKFFDGLAEQFDLLAIMLGGNQAKIEDMTAKHHKALIGGLDKKFTKEANIMMGSLDYQKQLQDKELALKEAYTNADLMLTGEAEKERQRILDEQMAINTKKLLDFEELKEELTQKYADKMLPRVKKNYDVQTQMAEDFQKKFKKIQDMQSEFPKNNFSDFVTTVFGETKTAYGILINSEEDLERAREKSNEKLAAAIDMWNTLKKLAETPTTTDPDEEDDPDAKRKRDQALDDWYNLEKRKLEIAIQAQKELVENEELSADERYKANSEYMKLSRDLVDLTEKYELKKYKDRADRIKQVEVDKQDELTKIQKEGKDNRDMISEDAYNKEVKRVEDDLKNRELAIQKEITKYRNSLIEQGKKREEIEFLVNERMEELRKADLKDFLENELLKLKAIAITAENRIEIAKKIADIEEMLSELSMPNSEKAERKLKALRSELEQFIETTNKEFFSAGGFDNIKKLFFTFETLEDGTIKSKFELLKEEAKDAGLEVQFMFTSIGNVAKEAFSTLGSLSGAYFEGQAQKYQDDIERNTDYYAQILDNEELTEVQRDAIEAERDRKERELEKKKREAERKAAIVAKINALIGVAISTAQAVVATQAPPPIGAGPLTGATLIPQVIALGALQAAAIAAQPIPSYEKGKGEYDNYEGTAIWGERRREIKYSPSDNTIEMSPQRIGNHLTYVKKDDVIFPDANKLITKLTNEQIYNMAVTVPAMNSVNDDFRYIQSTTEQTKAFAVIMRSQTDRMVSELKKKKGLRINQKISVAEDIAFQMRKQNTL